jgi:hypothetical protein
MLVRMRGQIKEEHPDPSVKSNIVTMSHAQHLLFVAFFYSIILKGLFNDRKTSWANRW